MRLPQQAATVATQRVHRHSQRLHVQGNRPYQKDYQHLKAAPNMFAEITDNASPGLPCIVNCRTCTIEQLNISNEMAKYHARLCIQLLNQH